MKRLIGLVLILAITFSLAACSNTENLTEDVQTDSAVDENNSEDETEQIQSTQLNEVESSVTATINGGTFTITEELDKTIYEFYHPELAGVFKNKDGNVDIYYMLEGDEGGWYSTSGYYSVPFLIQASFDEENNEFQAILHNGVTDEIASVDYIFEDNTIKLIFTELNYKPAEYEFILISMSTDDNNFYYEGHFTEEVFDGETAEDNSFNVSILNYDVTLTNGRDTIEVTFKEDGIHFDFTGENALGNGYAIIPDATELVYEAVAVYYVDDEILESERNLLIEISENGNLFTLQYADSSFRIWEYTIKE